MTAPDPKPARFPKAQRRNRRRSDLELGAALAWNRKATAFGCRVCHELGEKCEGVVQGHHIVRAQVIRRYVEALAYAGNLTPPQKQEMELALLWDSRNALGVCYRAHRRHHNRTQPIPLALLPPAVFVFAAEHGFARILEQDYA